jgi:hypothetical protein
MGPLFEAFDLQVQANGLQDREGETELGRGLAGSSSTRNRKPTPAAAANSGWRSPMALRAGLTASPIIMGVAVFMANFPSRKFH